MKTAEFAAPVGSVAGSAYLVPNPEEDHGYTETYGEASPVTAIAVPTPLKATEVPLPDAGGSVAGLAYLVPNPEPDHA